MASSGVGQVLRSIRTINIIGYGDAKDVDICMWKGRSVIASCVWLSRVL